VCQRKSSLVHASPPKATMSRSRGDVAQHRVSQMHACDGAPLRFVRLCPPCTGVDRASGSGEIAGGLHFLRWYDCARTGQSGSDCRGEQLGAGQMPQYGRQRQWHRRSGASRRPAREPVVLVGSSRGHWTRGRVLVSPARPVLCLGRMREPPAVVLTPISSRVASVPQSGGS
jgi:hypothetical protein